VTITKTHIDTKWTDTDGQEHRFCGPYFCDEPEFVGRMPIRTELTVLPADPKRDLVLGWTCTEYNGCEVCLPYTKTTINNKNGLRVGMTVLIWDSMLVTIRKLKGNWYWETKDSFGILEYSKDSRKCWTAPNIISKKISTPETYYQYWWQDFCDRVVSIFKKDR
jgi:hypothetical protein